MDFKDTIFLPKTDFQMRGNLTQKEPEILSNWNSADLYKKMRQKLKGEKEFILHDGPPFANGTPHAGHALNKIVETSNLSATGSKNLPKINFKKSDNIKKPPRRLSNYLPMIAKNS